MSNVKEYTKEYLEKNIKPLLKVGASIKIGKHYADEIGGFKPGEIITLIEGHFDYDNGLYTVDQTAPSVWNKDAKEFDSIYHLFGNDLENFFDCEVLTEPPMSNNQLPDEITERIKADAEAATDKEEVRLKALNQEYGRMVSQLHGHEAGYIAGATAYATKWFTCFEENGKMAEVIAAYATKLHEAQQENKEWKEECDRLAKLVEFWQAKYNDLKGPSFTPPKIDNNPLA